MNFRKSGPTDLAPKLDSSELIGLMAQDTALFQQLFALQEAMLDFREKIACDSDTSSDELSTSPYRSPSSTLSTSSDHGTTNRVIRHDSSASFVRHRVSYPPIARNRSRRIKSPPSHGCQDSYDSGIHTSDLEIFV